MDPRLPSIPMLYFSSIREPTTSGVLPAKLSLLLTFPLSFNRTARGGLASRALTLRPCLLVLSLNASRFGIEPPEGSMEVLSRGFAEPESPELTNSPRDGVPTSSVCSSKSDGRDILRRIASESLGYFTSIS